MAFIVPYNDGMRLGMGFNSFTQEICINNAVRPEGDVECPPHPQVQSGMTTAVHVCRDITWTSKFVDRMSELATSLGISGPLAIKSDALGGRTASASILDSNNFADSDINYLIQVKVTKQHLVATNLTTFSPIKGLSESDFTRIHGDSFISGYAEGGEFSALISIKLKDRSQINAVRGKLTAKLVSTEVSSEGQDDAEEEIDGEMTFAVSWRGGDVQDGLPTQWTLETLKTEARRFPERALAFSTRTNALLTKYTSLNSFYGTPSHGLPLDYANVGMYSSSLLDAYMDYKRIWRNCQTAIWQVEQGRSELLTREDMPELAEMVLEAKESYDNQLARYEHQLWEYERVQEMLRSPVEAQTHPSTAPVSSTRREPPRPLPPHGLVPYKASISGLEKAMRDCRLERIKIVQEVDAVTDDPTVATDPNRSWLYLSPSIFRTLLPTVKNLEQERLAQQAQEDAQHLAEERAHNAQLQEKLMDIQRHLELSDEKLKASETMRQELQPYGGWCPVTLNTPIRLMSQLTKKCVDFDWTGVKCLHQYDTIQNPNQKWAIDRAGSLGFYIRHMDSGQYIATKSKLGGDNRAYLTMRELGSVFTFEAKWDGVVWIHLADRNEYTLHVEGGNAANGTNLILWPYYGKGSYDSWYIKSFDDISS